MLYTSDSESVGSFVQSSCTLEVNRALERVGLGLSLSATKLQSGVEGSAWAPRDLDTSICSRLLNQTIQVSAAGKMQR